MSLQTPDRFYSDQTPSEEALGQAYVEYLEGLTFKDLPTLRSSANIISMSDAPLADLVESNAIQYEDDTLDGADVTVATEYMLSDVVRSYVYSGLRISSEMILIAAAAHSKDKRWLRDVIKPRPLPVMQDVLKTENCDARLTIFYGNRAMRELDLSTSIGEKFMELLASRGKTYVPYI